MGIPIWKHLRTDQMAWKSWASLVQVVQTATISVSQRPTIVLLPKSMVGYYYKNCEIGKAT